MGPRLRGDDEMRVCEVGLSGAGGGDRLLQVLERQCTGQDAVANHCPVYAGNLGYGPNPKLVQRVKDADLLLVVGARGRGGFAV